MVIVDTLLYTFEQKARKRKLQYKLKHLEEKCGVCYPVVLRMLMENMSPQFSRFILCE